MEHPQGHRLTYLSVKLCLAHWKHPDWAHLKPLQKKEINIPAPRNVW